MVVKDLFQVRTDRARKTVADSCLSMNAVLKKHGKGVPVEVVDAWKDVILSLQDLDWQLLHKNK